MINILVGNGTEAIPVGNGTETTPVENGTVPVGNGTETGNGKVSKVVLNLCCNNIVTLCMDCSV